MADPRDLRRKDLPDGPLHRWVRWRYCWWLPTRSEMRAVCLDVRARLAGWCHHCPYTGDLTDSGGYAHWRCQLRRGHPGLHRFVNYVWTDDGETDYLPQPAWHTDQHGCSPWSQRQLTGTYRQRMRRMTSDCEREAMGRRRG